MNTKNTTTAKLIAEIAIQRETNAKLIANVAIQEERARQSLLRTKRDLANMDRIKRELIALDIKAQRVFARSPR
jgi:hypothetical protein